MNCYIIKTAKYIGYIVGLLLILLVALGIYSSLNLKNSPKLYTVQSGSMEPTIHVGSMVIVKSQPEYYKNEIITIKEVDNPQKSYTHRIIDIKDLDSNPKFHTQGDANESEDIQPATKDRIIGKVLFTIPLVGYFIAFSRTQTGFLLLIALPASILLMLEIKGLIVNTSKVIKSKKNEK